MLSAFCIEFSWCQLTIESAYTFLKIQLQHSKSCMCVTSAEKFKKRQSWKMWPVFLYFAKQPLSSLYREVWRSGKGDRVKERACEWVESELCIVKKKAQKWKHIFLKKPHLIGALIFFFFGGGGAFFVWERRGSYNTRVIKSKSNPKNFLESVYSNLKNPTNSCWIQVSF